MFNWFSKGTGRPKAASKDDWKRVIGDLEYLQKAHARSHPWLAAVEPGATDADFTEQFMAHFHDTMLKAGITQAGFEEWRGQMEARFKARPFSRYEDPMAHFWLQQMQGQIEQSCQRLNIALPKQPVFGSLQTGRINGIAADVDNPSYYLILIDDGIMGFANLLSKVVAVFFPVVQAEDGTLNFATDEENIVRRRLESPEPGMRFFDLLTAYAVGGAPHAARPYLLASQHVQLVNIFRDAMELFIFGHEYGHCAAGHLQGAPRMSLAMAADGAGEGGEIQLRMPESWEKELEADYIGLALAMDAMRAQGFAPTLTYAGIELVFTGIDYMQRTLSILEHGEARERPLDTHPPAVVRREAMRANAKQMLGEETAASALDLAETVTNCLEFYWRPAMPALQQMHQDGIRPHARWSQRQH
ncbi:MAG: hypothetical protein ACK4MQ_10160 [Hyphomonas sp.]